MNWGKRSWQKPNGLYFGDSLGTGMDNLPRYPRNFEGSENAIKLDCSKIHLNYQDRYSEEWHGGNGRGAQWNKQGTFIDMSSQVALNALNISKICEYRKFPDIANIRIKIVQRG